MFAHVRLRGESRLPDPDGRPVADVGTLDSCREDSTSLR